MANPAIVVDFIANTDKLAAGFRAAQGQASTFGDRIKGIGKAGLAAAGAAGLAALTATVKTGIDEFSEASKVSAQTAATLKSTGGAAGVSAKQISNLAGALMKKSGVDDEAIQSGANLLLTFTNIRNEAGRGNDVFNQTTRAALDMSVALGTDMKSASMQLGKALNDPIKGVTKLTRSGVTFTDAQKKQIEALQKSGDTLGAQKIILAEVNKEFGGSAAAAGKTLPGQIAILRESFSNLAGELIGQLVPAFTAIMGVFTKVLGALGQYKGVLPVIVIALAGLAAATFAVNAALAAYAAITYIVRAATLAWQAAQWLLNAAMAANPFVLVALAVAALVAAFVVAYRESETFRKIVDAAFSAVLAAASAVFEWLKANWPLLLGIITGPVGLAVVLVVRYWDTIKAVTGAAWTWVKNATTGTWTAIRNFINGALSSIASLVSGAWAAVKAATAEAWGAVKEGVQSAAGSVRTAITALGTWVSSWITGTWAPIKTRLGNIFDSISASATGAVSGVKGAINDMLAWISGKLNEIKKAGSDIADGISAPINAVIKAWNGLQIPRVEIKIPKKKILGKTVGGGSFGFGPVDFPDIHTLARGGVIDGPTLALVGEGGDREIVTPEALLRQIVGERQQAVQVRVFIGEQELTSLVRTEIVSANTGLARALLAG